uniref:dolichyl-diphosphooligosaccharide--protein glycotransferase n=2 Tax=Nannochloropsis gaditana TaxID=72520 RepID=I2CR01_NANGC
MSSKHDKKKSKHQASSGTGVDALLDAFSNSKNASMAAKTAEWEQKGDAGVVGDDDLSGIPVIVRYGILGLICLLSFAIRLFAVVRYESVIHEFDPYFNFRTTKYLASEGFLEFLDWFDDRGWYPLGRIIGGTIYPGLMFTAAVMYWVLNFFNVTVNIREVCVFCAPIFAGNTAIASYLLTTEVTKRSAAGLLAAAFAGIVPSYISRSVGGSYDNEGVAIFALVFTFYLWIKAVHTGSMMWAALTALSYFYMVAAWGGYVFIINIIPIHVLALIVAGRFSKRLYVAYSTFYVLGSILAMQVPFVGFNVINQAECAASHGVFILLQVYTLVTFVVKALGEEVIRRLVYMAALLVISLVAVFIVSMQLLGKVQWTGRSLTLLDPTYATKYIPIIASVSEHQPTTWTSFFFDLHILVPFSPVGLYFLFQNPSDGAIFLILYGTLSWYFAGVMVRLMLTLAPIACILSAIGISAILRRFAAHLAPDGNGFLSFFSPKPSKKEGAKPSSTPPSGLSLVVLVGMTLLLCLFGYHANYVSSIAYSSPSIVIDAGRMPDGRRVMFDDYREAYFWLRQNTDPNAKILSWWDYGYQMSAMANRTVIVDNNTWNNTHIATVGRALASTEEDAYPILESLDVDYVLVIFGGLTGYSSDDINKFLWPVRIGSGVFPNDMPNEKDFFSDSGFDVGPQGSKVLHNCLAYKLCYYRFGETVGEYGKPPGFDRARNKVIAVKNIQLTTLEEAFTSEHWIVRIYKVLPRPNMISKKKASKKKKAVSSSGNSGAPAQDVVEYVGCFSSENMFVNKEYTGGAAGANFNLIRHTATAKGKRYFATARGGPDGHGWIFDTLAHKGNPQGDMFGEGCERPCADEAKTVCGCMDDFCTGPPPPGEEHNRRWAVYEIKRGKKGSSRRAA